MNQRIQELAIEAGYKHLPTVRLAFHGFDKEKFAELIIKECADAADIAVEADCDDIGLYIVEHFGLE